MNTLWHMFWTYVLFRKQKWCWKAVLFALIPDVMQLAELLILLGSRQMTTFHFEYSAFLPLSELIQSSFHSTLVFVLILAVVIWLKKKTCYGYFYGWGFHILTDYFTHKGYAYNPLYPYKGIGIEGLVSFYKPQYYSNEFNVTCYALASLFALYLLVYKEKTMLNDVLVSGITAITLLAGLVFFPLVGYTPWSLKFLWMPFILLSLVVVQNWKSLELRKIYLHLKKEFNNHT